MKCAVYLPRALTGEHEEAGKTCEEVTFAEKPRQLSTRHTHCDGRHRWCARAGYSRMKPPASMIFLKLLRGEKRSNGEMYSKQLSS